jgi:hypothetical protein
MTISELIQKLELFPPDIQVETESFDSLESYDVESVHIKFRGDLYDDDDYDSYTFETEAGAKAAGAKTIRPIAVLH